MTHKGFSGLANLGNTCYINSALFILSHIDILNNYIIENYKKSNSENILLSEWIELYNIYWNKNCIIIPNKFINYNRTLFKKLNKYEFIENEQCDSIEYLLFFIETLHKSFNNDIFFNSIFDIECHIKYLDEKKDLVYFEKYQKHWIFSLNIPDKVNIKIEECIKYTFNDEYIYGDNAWLDEKDNKKKNVYINSIISVSPKILILQLKRWNYKGNKIRSIINIEETLDLSFVSETKAVYELFGTINHSGSTNQGGHYFTSLKKNNKWYIFNDTTINEVKFSNIINETIYCLFYIKIK